MTMTTGQPFPVCLCRRPDAAADSARVPSLGPVFMTCNELMQELSWLRTGVPPSFSSLSNHVALHQPGPVKWMKGRKVPFQLITSYAVSDSSLISLLLSLSGVKASLMVLIKLFEEEERRGRVVFLWQMLWAGLMNCWLKCCAPSLMTVPELRQHKPWREFAHNWRLFSSFMDDWTTD